MSPTLRDFAQRHVGKRVVVSLISTSFGNGATFKGTVQSAGNCLILDDHAAIAWENVGAIILEAGA